MALCVSRSASLAILNPSGEVIASSLSFFPTDSFRDIREDPPILRWRDRFNSRRWNAEAVSTYSDHYNRLFSGIPLDSSAEDALRLARRNLDNSLKPFDSLYRDFYQEVFLYIAPRSYHYHEAKGDRSVLLNKDRRSPVAHRQGDNETEEPTEEYWLGILIPFLGVYVPRAKRLIGQTSLKVVNRLFSDEVYQAATLDEKASMVRTTLERSAKTRGGRWVRTEGVTASNFGNGEGAKSAGMTRKTWRSLHLPASRKTHTSADGQERKIEEDYSINGFPAAYPGDTRLPAGERCNCVCYDEFD